MTRKTYVIRDGKPVLKERAPNIIVHQVMPDIPDYVSPLGTGVITSRSKRREDLKRGGCREVDPSEHKVQYHNERFARKRGLPYTPKTEE